MQVISNLENWMRGWWMGLRDSNRRFFRFLICLVGSAAAGATVHYQNGTFWRQPEPVTIIVSIFTFFALFTFSILWTKTAKDEKSRRMLNEKLNHVNKQLTISAREMAEMNEQLAKWNLKLEEANAELENSQLQLNKANAELQRINKFDTLTGLHSRYYYEESKTRVAAEACRHKLYVLAIMVDVNRLKEVNDVLGHVAGDELLIYFANKVKVQVREADICARYGGDEIIILSIDSNENAAQQLAERILFDMNTWLLEIKGVQIKVSASIGYAIEKFDHKVTLDEIVKTADERMYHHKKTGSLLIPV